MPTPIDTAGRMPVLPLQTLVESLFIAVGAPREQAKRIAEIAIRADLRGAYSHGCALVPMYLDRMRRGLIDSKAYPSIRRDSGAVLVVDGHNSLGHVALSYAVDRAIERAKTTGICAVSVGGSNHCGAMGYYAMQALKHDMIAWVTTNGLPTMAWAGGLDRILSINPVGIAIPAGEELPIVIDMSFGAVARGKIAMHAKDGLPLPPGWALDRDGQPTIDAAAALEGLIVPAGGYKGTSMALVMGILSSLLSGAAYGTELGNMKSGPRPGVDGHFATIIDIKAFEEIGTFKARVDKVVREIRMSRRAEDTMAIWLPGERAAQLERQYRVEGVPITAANRMALRDAALSVGVDPTSILGT